MASGDWNNPGAVGAPFTPVITTVVSGKSNRNCSMVSGTTQVCNKTYGNNGWLGLASINVNSSGHITQGSAKMNDTYFNTTKYNNPNEKLHVMCQEVAHTFGLGHQSEDGSSQNSCMDYFSNTGTNSTSTLSTKPNYHDFEELTIIYGHLDSMTTVAPMSSATLGAIEDANDWGKLMSQSSEGRSSTYERTEPNGSKTITHVYWTQESVENCRSCDHRFEPHDD